MKITPVADLSNVKDAPTFMRFAAQLFNDIIVILNGNLEFDSNFKTQSVTVVFNATNKDMAVPHNLNKTGVKYIITSKSVACDVFTGLTPQTTSVLFLQSTQKATVTMELY